jgi:hypothetical protein
MGKAAETRFSENAYGDGIAERKAREARLAAVKAVTKAEARWFQYRSVVTGCNFDRICLQS